MKAQAKDVINTKVISVKVDTTLKKAIQLLNNHKISGLPVLDNKDDLVGILTESDIVEYCRRKHVVPLLDTTGWTSPYEKIWNKHDYRTASYAESLQEEI